MPDLLTTYIPHRDELYSAVLADVLDGLGHRSSALPPSVRPLRQEWRLFGRAISFSAMSMVWSLCPRRWLSKPFPAPWKRCVARTECVRSWPRGGVSARCLRSTASCEGNKKPRRDERRGERREVVWRSQPGS